MGEKTGIQCQKVDNEYIEEYIQLVTQMELEEHVKLKTN